MSHFQFQYVDGPVGSHKTQSLLSHLRSYPHAATICTQTNSLSDQYQAAEGLNIEKIWRQTGTDRDYPAASKIYRERLSTRKDGIYAVNQQVAIRCQDSDPDRHYYFDEIPSVFETFKFNSLPLSHDFVAGWLGSEFSEAPEYYELTPTEQIRHIAENGWNDDLLKGCKDILVVAQRIACPHYRVFVPAKAYNAFKNGIPRQLQFFVVARPSLFPKRSIFIGANYKNSLQYLIWSASEDVEFIPHPHIKSKHVDLRHKAANTEIYYLSERRFSKALFAGKMGGAAKAGATTRFKKIAKATGEAIAKQFPGIPFLYCTNTSYEQIEWAGPFGNRISSNSRGWNDGRSFNMAVFMAAINFDPAASAFLSKVFGINDKAARYALTYEAAYQFAGRTSLRAKDVDDRERNERATLPRRLVCADGYWRAARVTA
jgi:hypothetical protein